MLTAQAYTSGRCQPPACLGERQPEFTFWTEALPTPCTEAISLPHVSLAGQLDRMPATFFKAATLKVALPPAG